MFRIFNQQNNNYLNYIISHRPDAIAYIKGNKDYPNIDGKSEFYQTNSGVLILTEVKNLKTNNNCCNFYAMHIHNGDSCELKKGEFEESGHYNPNDLPHPNHAGDLPNILSNDGYVYNLVLTNRINVKEILGKTIFIHEFADDARTDPSGNSGKKIACGKIITRL